jgi:hypothetical protein
MVNSSQSDPSRPVLKGVSYFLAHVPSMVRYGSKPSREIPKDPSLLPRFLGHLRSFNEAVAYAPNQVFIGNMDPDELNNIAFPWHQNLIDGSFRLGPFGEIMPEDEFYGVMKMCDEFQLMLITEKTTQEIAEKFRNHPLFNAEDIQKLSKGVPIAQVNERTSQPGAVPLYVDKDRLVGCLQRATGGGAEEDPNLTPEILMENLAARASGVMALRHLVSRISSSEDIDYLLGCGEEAIGDRYNRGGGNIAKAIGQLAGCNTATGSDVKAFCCAPVHAIVLAASLVVSGTFKNVAVVAGGSLAKLGMKFEGHLRHDQPILEDLLAGIAVLVSRNDGRSPVIRLDSIGKHEINSGSAQQAIMEKLVVEPLDRLGLKLGQVDKYATEMHNPEITEPQGSGNVPRTNYRTIAAFAVLRDEIRREDLDQFVRTHGMPGFSPTQGHIASAVPVLGHAVRRMMAGQIKNTMFLAKGSLFLGRVTQLSDGMSFLLEKNSG